MKTCTKRMMALVLMLSLLLTLVVPVAAAPSATNIVTTPTDYTSAEDVVYVTSTDGFIANWGARGETASFLSTYAESFYTGDYTYAKLSALSGGTSSTAHSSALYAELNELALARQHTITTYDGCRDLYMYTDCVSNDTSKVSLFYMGDLVDSKWDGGTTYNREHCWPKSKLTYETKNDGADIMHIRPANPSTNSSRGNTAYGAGDKFYDPGVSVHGDTARMILYMYVRWGNKDTLWDTSGTFESLDVLLKWMEEDPVDTWEMGRNDAIESITGARNMFVDYPELAFLLFNETVPADMATPSNGLGAGSGLIQRRPLPPKLPVMWLR